MSRSTHQQLSCPHFHSLNVLSFLHLNTRVSSVIDRWFHQFLRHKSDILSKMSAILFAQRNVTSFDILTGSSAQNGRRTNHRNNPPGIHRTRRRSQATHEISMRSTNAITCERYRIYLSNCKYARDFSESDRSL